MSGRCLGHIYPSLLGDEMHFLRDVINVRHEAHFWLLPPLPLKGGFYESSFVAVHAVGDDRTPLKVTTKGQEGSCLSTVAKRVVGGEA